MIKFFFFCQVGFGPLWDLNEVMIEEKTEQLCCSSRVLEARLLRNAIEAIVGATLLTTERLAIILKDGDGGDAGDISSNTSISPVCLFPSFPLFTLIS